MTKLERQLAETFKAARWAESQGRPICPSCYDHQSVVPDRSPRSGQPGLQTYSCRDCHARWSDVSGTVLTSSSRPLRDWAIALLIDRETCDWRFFQSDTGCNARDIRRLRRRWDEGSRLGPVWVQTLTERGLTLERLLAATPQGGAHADR